MMRVPRLPAVWRTVEPTRRASAHAVVPSTVLAYAVAMSARLLQVVSRRAALPPAVRPHVVVMPP
jgi:hypothetical protein